MNANSSPAPVNSSMGPMPGMGPPMSGMNNSSTTTMSGGRRRRGRKGSRRTRRKQSGGRGASTQSVPKMGGGRRRRSRRKQSGGQTTTMSPMLKMMGGAMPAVGSKAQVWHGTARHTSGGLTKKDLMKHKGRIISRRKHALGKKALKNLVKAGYKAKKGTFKLFRK